MKHQLCRSALLSAVICSFAALASGISLNAQTPGATPSPAASVAPSSLVTNGDFSLATKDPTWPDDWNKGKLPGLSYETEAGKHFVRLTAQEPDKMLMLYREVAIPSGVTSVQITIHYRTSGVTAGTENYMNARAIFHFVDDNHKTVPPDPHILTFSIDATTWTEATETCAVPTGATKLVLMPSLYRVTAGILDLADISVTPVQ